MADPAVSYVLATGGGNITFNDGSEDQFYITEIQGLGSAPIRAPIDNAPQAHGGLVHDFWKGPRHLIIDGIFLITSVPQGTQCQAIRNDMEEDLRAALDSILQTDGTLTWTPVGLAQRVLTVRHDVPLECPHQDNYLLRAFNFGLVAADPDWV